MRESAGQKGVLRKGPKFIFDSSFLVKEAF